MDRKLYVLKNGENPGIYLDWLSFFEKIDGRQDVRYRVFYYDSKLSKEDESVVHSMKWAFKMAKEYLNSADEQVEISPHGEVILDDFERIIQETEMELDEELRRTLGLNEELRMGSVWLDMLLQLAGMNHSWAARGGFSGRYFPPVLYVLLMYLVLDVEPLLDEMFRYQELLSDKRSSGLEKENWYGCIRYELAHSREVKELRERFEKNKLKKRDLNEVTHRIYEYIEKGRMLQTRPSYSSMQTFLVSGKHTLVELYEELVSNAVYKKELEDLAGVLRNPDLEVQTEEVLQDKEEAPSIEQLVEQTSAIRTALKKVIVGQDEAIDKLEKAFFHTEKMITGSENSSPRSVYLFAGPPGVGKTYMAENFAKALGRSYRRFDMSTYASVHTIEEIAGVSSLYANSKPGVLTSYVYDNPRSVLLFDEIEKAHIDVLRLFLQILDEGICFDRYYDRNVSFKDCIIIMTTNAGKQLYESAGNESLAELSERVIIDAFEKDINPQTGQPYFPPEIVSRMASHTIIMFNHLKADAIRRVIKNDIEKMIKTHEEKFGFDISKGSDIVAATVQYSVGGAGDARTASRLAGKLVDKELYELFELSGEKIGADAQKRIRQVSWECDFADCSEEIRQFYLGEKDCVVPILKAADKEYDISVSPMLCVKVVNDIHAFMEIVRKEKVLFAVVDYTYGMKISEMSMSIADAKTIGGKAFRELKAENTDIPVFLLKNDAYYLYSESEKRSLLRAGAEGFIDEGNLVKQIQKAYIDVCCKNAMELLAFRHQVLTYATRQEISESGDSARIIFYNLKLEMAVDAEDMDSLISEELRPNKKWKDIYVSKEVKEELDFFVNYLKNPKEYLRTGARVPRGALMYGPPGTGKTSLAKVVASESNINFLSISADELKSGGAPKVHNIFQVARKYAPAVLFIDEIDAIGVSRNETGANSILNALLTEMDGFKRMDSKPVFVMAATNLRRIDAALARRFDRTFKVGLPKEDGRRWLLKRLLRIHAEKFFISENELESIVQRSSGLSPADLENIIETALREGIRSGTVIGDALLDEVFEKCNYGEREEKSSDKEEELTAYHEAGHALIELYYGRQPEYMSVIAREEFGGYVQQEKMNEHPTKERLLQRICTSLGGRAAELEFGFGLTPGASGDLAAATKLAIRMVCELGMYEDEIGLAVISAEEYRLDEQAKKLVNRILKEQLEQAKRIIAKNRGTAARLAEAVLQSEKKYLTKKDIVDVYEGF